MKIFKRIRVPLARVLTGLALLGVLWGLSVLAYAGAEKPDGDAIFLDNCSMCHGEDGKGLPAIHTPNFTDPKWQDSIKDVQILDAIKHGVKGTAMPSWAGKLSERQMLAVLKRVRDFNRKRH